MKKLSILRITLLAWGIVFMSSIGCHEVEQLRPDHPRLAAGVAMQDVTFYSAALKRDMDYRVFLPAKLPTGDRLATVYLLHGGGGGFKDWSNYSDVARFAAPDGGSRGLILVMPEGDSSYFMNAAEKPQDRFEDYVVNDLISDVEARFAVAKGRENRAIVGVSMGGFAAVELALTHPGLFSFVGAISPAIDVPSRRFSWRRWAQSSRFRAIFGPEGSETRQECDPFILVRTADPGRTPYIYLTAGLQEALLEPNRRFAAMLKQRQFLYEFHTKPGGHGWGEWDAQIPGCFEEPLSRIGPSR